MSLELTILYDGDSDALRAHRLSVADFGQPLRLLLAAVQRTASGIVGQAVGGDYGLRGGRLADVAKQLDIQIASMEGGCVQLQAALVHSMPAGTDLELPGLDLAERALLRLVEDIEAESQGHYRNAAVRRYLQALPNFVTRQAYVAKRDGSILREVNVATMDVAPAPAAAVRLTRTSGTVSAVVLEAGRERVTLKSEAGLRVAFAASAGLVERALALRDQPVLATSVAGAGDDKRTRLLRLDPLDADIAGDPGERLASLADQWAVALEALSK